MTADDQAARTELAEAEARIRHNASMRNPKYADERLLLAEYDRLRRENRELIADEHELTRAQAEAKHFRDQLRGSIGRANDWRDTALEVSRHRDEELARVRDLEAELVAVRSQLDRVRPVLDAALVWQDRPAKCTEDVPLMQALDAYRAVLDGQETRHA